MFKYLILSISLAFLGACSTTPSVSENASGEKKKEERKPSTLNEFRFRGSDRH